MDMPIEKAASIDAIKGSRAELLRRRVISALEQSSVGIPAISRDRALPLSFAQERLWFLDRLGRLGPAYHIGLSVRVKGTLDRAALSAALTDIVRRHEAIRTRFPMRDGVACQLIDPPWQIELAAEVVTLAEATCRAQALMEAPFELASDRLLRCALLKLGELDHILTLSMHHIISDGWSIGILFRELAAHYGAHTSRRSAPLPPLQIHYADYAAWHRGFVSEHVFEAQLAYWRERLADAPAGLDMPTDRPRPPSQSFRGATHRFVLDRKLSAALAALARQQGATLFMTLLAGFKALLARWSGQRDIVVGSPIAGRVRAETEEMIGFFVNLLALRTDLTDDPSFQLLVQRTKQTALGAYAHQDLPFEQVVDALQPGRDLSRQPIFQTVFVLQDVSLAQMKLPGLEIELFDDVANAARFDLELSMTDVGGELAGAFVYATDLFDAATIERLAGHFVQLLRGAARNPQARLSELPLLSDAERACVLVEWNTTQAATPACRTMHELFSAQAVRTPDAPALIHHDEILSYAEVERRSNQLARHLRQLGVGPDVVVGLCVGRSFDMMIGVLGVQKAGGAYLPLDPNYPAERLAYMIADARTPVVLTQSGMLDQVESGDALVVRLDETWPDIASLPTDAPAVAVDPSGLAYVIYTSGSTGQPKGVMTAHSGALNLAEAQVAPLQIVPGSRVLQFASFSFDAAVWELLMSWRSGSALVIADRHELLPGEPLRELLERQQIGVVLLPPSALSTLPAASLPDLKTLLLGGEACTAELVAPWLGGRVVLNAYGPTESSVCTTVFPCVAERRTPAIGRPLANTRTYVLDEHLEPVPIGAPGELYIGGAGLARGYLFRPALTAERFLPNPFSRGERLYKTGDLVRWRADGELEFLGRLDHQVKIRGFRIELGEIEAALLSESGVAQANVIAREDMPGNKRLVAYVVPDLLRLKAERRQGAQASDDNVAAWQSLFDQTYGETGEAKAPSFIGWNDSTTGEPIPLSEMEEWKMATVTRIASLSPERVLEIGCGVGLLLQHLAPIAREYRGTDISSAAIEGLRAWARTQPALAHVALAQREATALSDMEKASVDTVVINSVVQYFPDTDYLRDVLEGASALVRDGGQIFVGDVRHFGLLPAFHTSIEAARASADARAADISSRGALGARRETEFAIAPAFFLTLQEALPRISAVEILLKRGRANNELTRYRYDVVLHVGGAAVQAPEQSIDWAESSLSALATTLEERRPASVAVLNVPNGRLARDLALQQQLDAAGPLTRIEDVLRAVDSNGWDGEDPEAFWSLGEQRGYDVRVSWTSATPDGRFDVVFIDRSRIKTPIQLPRPSRIPLGTHANDPGGAALMQQLGQRLRRSLQQRLPEHMVPAAFVTIDALPLTPAGKVDRRALPAPEGRPEVGRFVAPRTAAERTLAAIWCEILKLDQVGVEDNFFALGGDSIQSIQVVARANKAGLKLTSRQIFEHQTIASLAAAAGTASADNEGPDRHVLSPPLSAADGQMIPALSLRQAGVSQADLDRVLQAVGDPAGIEDVYPLSPTQQGMLFHSLYEPQSRAYVTTLSCRLLGNLDTGAFREAWEIIVARHAVLRSAFVGHELDLPLQVVMGAVGLPFTVHDWQGIAAAEQENRLDALQRAECAIGFDLVNPPLMRLSIIQVAAQDYRLVWCCHHILFDGWSISILLDEVFAAYAARCRREAPQLGPVQPFRHYIDWLRSQDVAAAGSYWRGGLAGFGAPTALGFGHASAAAYGQDRYAEHDDEFPLETTAIERFARQHRLTINTLVQGAWALLLGRYASSDDVVFGVTVSGRPAELADVERIVGMFINTLPLRVALPGDALVLDWLRTIQTRQSELTDYQFTALADVQRWSEVPSGTPLFESIVVFENYPAELSARAADHAVHIDMIRAVNRINYPLALQVAVGRSLSLKLMYDAGRFDGAAIARLAGHLRRLLESIIADPQARLSALSLMDDTELHQVVSAFNDTVAAYPREVPLHALFVAQAARTPDAAALHFADKTLSYGELDRRTNQLARHLRGLGVGPDVVVGICAERSFEMVIALLGILKAGGAYLPLDPSYPAERLAYMLADARAPVLLVQAALADRLPASDATVLRLDADWPEIAEHADMPPDITVDPCNLAYVIYTSGSTGRPKGVMNAHRGIVNRIAWMQEAYRLAPNDRVMQKTPFGFDVSVWEFFWPLTHGAELVIARPGGHQDPAYLAELIKESGVTVMHFVPSMLQAFLDAADLGRCSSLRDTFCSGEALPAETQNRFLHALPTCRLHNLYGPTEAAVDVSAWACQLEPAATQVPIGRPISNIQLYVLDQHLAPVPVGIAGELYIGGIGVARGYHGKPSLTAERFVPNPFDMGKRLYCTGDLARWRSDGALDYLGRTDHQVKIRGFRIELGEIEAALLAHPDVEQAAAVVRDDTGQRRLVGYVAMRGEMRADTDALRQHLQRSLPDHMVPAAMVRLEKLPLSANGKLDRNALPAPDWHGTTKIVAPRNANEQALVAIWRDVLKLDHVSVTDNFFALGGDSIQSIQVVARASRAGLTLTARQVFEQQTIAGLAAVAGQVTAIAAEQGLVQGEVPLTPIQHWFFEQQLAAPQHFNQAVLLDYEGLMPALVSDALSALSRHHDALRLRFCSDGARWRQLHADDEAALHPTCEAIDLSELGGLVQPAALKAHADRLQASLDLTNGPLMRAALFDLGAGQQSLLVIIHHLVVDGVSWRILVEDLGTSLTALQNGEQVTFAPKTTSFQAWAEHLVGYAGSDALRRELLYWQAQPWESATRLPLDHPGETNIAAVAQVVSSALSAADTRALLQDVPSVYRTHINDVLLTALVETFAGWTGTRSLLVALEGHGREDLFTDVDVSRTVGWFTSLVPVLLDIGAAAGPGEALKLVKEELRAVPNHGIGYGLLRYLGDADALPAPRPEVSFNYLGQLDDADSKLPSFRFTEDAVGSLHAAENPRAHLIDISAHVRDGRLHLQWFYNTALHDAATITALAERYGVVLQKLIAHCEASLGGLTPSDVPLAQVSQSELDRLVAAAGEPRNVEDIYPLSPTQRGILFHSLYAPDSSVYVISLACRLQGDLDVDAFERAWQAAVAHHPVLRSAFVGHDREMPLQMVLRELTLPFIRYDWRDVSAAEQAARLADLQAAERRQGFDFARPPLMRLALVRMDERDYRLLWNSHHILLDGWSMPLLLNDVFSAYSALSRRDAPHLTATRPFRDYIDWLQRQDRTAAEACWRTQLAGFAAPTTIGLGRPTAATARDDRYREHTRELVTTLTDVEGFARRHRLTINTLVQGAWALLLGRYADSDDVVFGVTVSGRPAEMAEIERTVGLFINTLPLRVALPNGTPVLDWLRTIQARQSELTDYQYAPLADVQRWSEVPSGTPLFDSIVAFENYPVDMSALSGLMRSIRISDVQALERTNYPLTLQVTVGERLSFRLIADAERFEASAIERLMDHLLRLLEGIIDDPQARLSALPMLDDPEREQVCSCFNDTEAAYPQDVMLQELFAAQAARTPEAVALRSENTTLSYGELDRRTNQLAHHLRGIGIGPDVVVGVCAERSFEMVIALLAILKAGGAYLPLDPSYPAERLAYMLGDAKAPLLLVQAALADRLPASEAAVVRLDADWPDIARQPETALAATNQPGNLAYVIYTSGSTGRPKGVMNAHRGIVNRIAWMQDAYRLTPDDRVMQKTPFSFDVSVWEFFWPLAYGAELVIARPGGHQDPCYLAELIEQAGVTIMHFVPSMLQAFLEAAELGRCGSLRDTICSGEALPVETQNRFLGALQSRLHNLYGPTEAAVDVSAWACRLEPVATQVPIGRPINNIQLYVLDHRSEPVPIGVAGELHIGGIGVARGYHGRPGLTAERFVPDPFKPGERLYRTGDLACWRSDGALDYLGRIDHQVKIRGFRIELGEIETALLTHPDVEQAAVVARDDTGERRLVGYVAMREGQADTEALRRHLQRTLPDHMVPAAMVQLAKLPLSANGKLDRNALPAPDWHGAAEIVAPRNATEQALAAIWRDVLKLDRISANDNFFALGGDSLSATRAIARIQRELEIAVPLRAMFETTTLGELADRVGLLSWVNTAPVAADAEAGLVEGVI